MDKEAKNSQKTIARALAILFLCMCGSAIIVFLLLPFGYNFTVTWLYSFMYLGYSLLLIGTVYICAKWWLLRNSEQAPPFGLAAALLSGSIGITLYFIRDLFGWQELNMLLCLIFIYMGLAFVIFANPNLKAFRIPITVYITLLLSVYGLILFEDQLQLSPQSHSLLQTSQFILTLLTTPLIIGLSLINRPKTRTEQKLLTEHLKELFQKPNAD